MNLITFLARQQRQFSRYGIIALYLTNAPVPSVYAKSVKMGFYQNFADASKEMMNKIRNIALGLGTCLSRCWGRWCACSDCLPSAETVGNCLYRFLVVIVFVFCFPCACTWCVCKAIVFCRRKKRDGSDRSSFAENGIAGVKREGYDTFQNDDTPDDIPDIQPRRLHNLNYLFYTNQLKSEPRGDYIDVILKEWHGNYRLLESHHGFIQWLFPLYESGVNSYAQVLNNEERRNILADDAAYRRIIEAYKLMLDFYGIELLNEETGHVVRSKNYEERFRNLNRNGHNFLRISRILKCLEIFECSHLTKPLVKFFITEIIQEETLPACRDSCRNFWIQTLDLEAEAEMRDYWRKLESEKAQKLHHEDLDSEKEKEEDYRMNLFT